MIPTVSHITAASALWNQRRTVAGLKERLSALFEAVNWPGDLLLYQWVGLLTFALEFQPDLILELGRGMGNSTCAFTEAASHLPGCRVVSICLSEDWDRKTLSRVKKVVPFNWFRPLTILRDDILRIDYKSLISDSQRVLLFWDAHGYDVAECVLGGILPLLENRRHQVIMHDISDARYLSREHFDYQGNRLWRGNDWEGPRLVLGTLSSCVEQAVAILDFTSRNQLSLHSADHSLHTEIGQDAGKMLELEQCLGEPFFDHSLQAHWVWFSLNEKDGPFYFPRFVPPADGPEPIVATRDFGLLRYDLARNCDKRGKPSFITRLRIAAKFLLGMYPEVRAKKQQ